MNAIDDIGKKIGVARGKDRDALYALRVLKTLHHTHEATHAIGWASDRETNEHILDTDAGTAYIGRDAKAKTWRWFVSVNKKTVAEGYTGNLEKAMMLCSLVLS